MYNLRKEWCIVGGMYNPGRPPNAVGDTRDRPPKCVQQIILITPLQSSQLRIMAKETHLSLSALVRASLDAYFESKKKVAAT